MMKIACGWLLISVAYLGLWRNHKGLPATEPMHEESIVASKLKSNGMANGISPPEVTLQVQDSDGVFTWNAPVRYSIRIVDDVDGDSKYGEIDPRMCILEVRYIPVKGVVNERELVKHAEAKNQPAGLDMMKQSTCFGCHADKTRLAGPSFGEIAVKYSKDRDAAARLGKAIIEGSTGKWGNQMMPAHPDLSPAQAREIVTYILEQGSNPNQWIYPGLEGSFRIIEKPAPNAEGVYVLTASYRSQAKIRAQQSVVLRVK